MSDDPVYDHHGNLLKVGYRVHPMSDLPGPPGERQPSAATVTKITDWDGDMRDGRMIGYPPKVYVLYDVEQIGAHGERWRDEDFGTYMRPDEKTYCDDLEVIE